MTEETKKMNIVSISQERAKGAFLGAAIGDALGWPQERLDLRLGKDSRQRKQPQISFGQWERRTGGRFRGYREIINAGEYSDDTQLILTTARSLFRGKQWSKYLINQELPFWLLYQRGAGRAITQAAKSWQSGIAPWKNSSIAENYFATGANGAAMRILPHALIPSISLDEMQSQVMLNSLLTHGHPRALLGAMLYAQALRFMIAVQGTLTFGELISYLLDTHTHWSSIRKKGPNYEVWRESAERYHKNNYENLWKATTQEIIDGLHLCESETKKGALASGNEYLKKINAFDKKVNGSGVLAALASIYFASLYATDPIAGLLEIAFAYGADTDTIASMAGGLLGALLGTEWIPTEWQNIQDKEYLCETAVKLLQIEDPTVEYDSLTIWKEQNSLELFKRLESLKTEKDSLDLGWLGQAEVQTSKHCQQMGNKWQPIGWQLQFAGGQTAYITNLVRPNTSAEKLPLIESQLQEQTKTKNDTLDIGSLFSEIYKVKPSSISLEEFFQILANIVKIFEEKKLSTGNTKFIEQLRKGDGKTINIALKELSKYNYTVSRGSLVSLIIKTSELFICI